MLRTLFLFCVPLLLGCPSAQPVPISIAGEGWTLTALDGGALSLARDGGAQLRFEPEAWLVGTVTGPLDDALSYDPYWLFVKDGVFSPVSPPGLRWHTPTSVRVGSDDGVIVLAVAYEDGLTATVTVANGDDRHPVLRFVPAATDATIAFLRVRARVDSSEAFYGLGEWFDGANHRGKLRPMQLEANLNVESANTENHVVTPFIVGSRGWGLFVESDRFGVFDIARAAPDLLDTTWGTAEESHLGLTLHLFSAAHALDVPQQYFHVTGLPRAPAEWALGPWLWRNENRDQAEVLDDLKTMRALDLATSGVWLDRPYATAVNTFDLDLARFPDAGGLFSDLAAAGVKAAVWHTPYLENTAEPLHSQAVAAGYFPKSVGMLLNKWGPPLDFTSPDASAFWTQNVTRYTRMGVEGFKLDFAEDVVAGLQGRASGWRFADGSSERTMHAQYTRLYHAAYRRALGENDGFMLVRSGKWGSQTAGVIVWPGDIDATLTAWGETFTEAGKSHVGVGGLPSAIRAGIGLSMCGFQFAADTGGYRHSPPAKETFLRWVEQSALMPVMQTGDSSSQPPWVFTAQNGRDDEALGVYRDYARLHLRLFPYFYSHLARLEAGTGRPIVQPFGLAFPETGVFPEDVYVLGNELLVAPVERAQVRTRTVPLPPMRHESWWTGASLEAEVDAPLARLPLYVRDGALVPMLRPTIDTLAPASALEVESFARSAGDLWVRVVPSPTATQFDLYDGARVEQLREGATVTLIARAGRVFNSAVVWEYFGAPPTSVTHGDVALEKVGGLAGLEGPRSGWAVEGSLVRIKHVIDGVSVVARE